MYSHLVYSQLTVESQRCMKDQGHCNVGLIHARSADEWEDHTVDKALSLDHGGPRVWLGFVNLLSVSYLSDGRCPITLASFHQLSQPGQIKGPSRHTYTTSVNLFDSRRVRISVVKTVLKWDSSSLHSLTKQRDSGSSDSDFMVTTPILLESTAPEVSCLCKNVNFL